MPEDHHMVQQRVFSPDLSIRAYVAISSLTLLSLFLPVWLCFGTGGQSLSELTPADTRTLSIQHPSHPIPDPSSAHAASPNSTELSGGLFHSPSQQ